MTKNKSKKEKQENTMLDETIEVLQNFELDVNDPKKLQETLERLQSANQYMSFVVWLP